MSDPVFHVPRDSLVGATEVVLEGAEGHHAATVRRLGPGERVVLTDGGGRHAQAEVVRAERDRLVLAVGDVRADPEPSPRLVVVQALPKGDRGELAVETLTEVGADVVVPWAAARCVTRWRDDRGRKALERWRATAREAAKQSRRTWWPEVVELASTPDVAGLVRGAALAVVLHEGADQPLAGVAVEPGGDVVLVVGPEGGLTDDELHTLGAAGATTRRLGPTVLRTSTAGTVAAAVVLARTPRWA